MTLLIKYISLGLAAGVFSGLFGLGGGVILIPGMIYLFGLTQHQAQGTSLAIMVPPITLLAAIRYYQSGNLKLGMALFIACGFAVGGLAGAHLVQYISGDTLKKAFGCVMLLIALRMIFVK